MTAPQLVRIVVSVSSLSAALPFYTDVVGATLRHQSPGMAVLDVSGAEVMLHERPSNPSDTGVSVVVAVDRLDDRVAQWAQQGGVVVDEPADQPWGERMAVVRDNDGHLVCLVAAP